MLISPPFPKLPKYDKKKGVKKRLIQIQKYIQQLEYNHTGNARPKYTGALDSRSFYVPFTGTRYFSVRKDRGMVKLTDTAKKIMTNVCVHLVSKPAQHRQLCSEFV